MKGLKGQRAVVVAVVEWFRYELHCLHCGAVLSNNGTYHRAQYRQAKALAMAEGKLHADDAGLPMTVIGYWVHDNDSAEHT